MMNLRSLFFGVVLTLFCVNASAQVGSVLAYWGNTAYDTATITRFNIVTTEADTLFAFPTSSLPGLCCCAYGSALDPFNKIYYFSIDGGMIVSYNIDSPSISIVANGMICHSHQYDQYTNSIVYLTKYAVKVHSLSDTAHTSITIPEVENCYLGPASAYDFKKGEFLFMTGYGEFPTRYLHWILVDVLNDSMIYDRIMPDSMFYSSLVYSSVSGKYYGFAAPVNNEALYEIDAHDLAVKKVCDLPADFYARYNFQTGTYDAASHTYILPYLSTNGTNKMAVIDLQTKRVLNTMPYLKNADLNQFFSKHNEASLIFRNDELIVSSGTSYDWYVNDTLISTTTENTITPVISGTYRAVVHTDDTLYATNSYLYTSLTDTTVDSTSAIVELNIQAELFPNPANDLLEVRLSAAASYVILVSDITGRQMLAKEISGNTTVLSLQSFEHGTYTLLIQDARSKKSISKNFVVTR